MPGAAVILNPMAIQHDHGKWGEDLAARHLEAMGYEVLEHNWRYKRAEVDLICRENGVLVFVEVKVRADLGFGRPEEMVDHRKKTLLTEAAMAYMRHIGYDWEIRFDIVAIHGTPDAIHSIEVIRDAFFPGLT